MQKNCRQKICKNCFIKQHCYVLAIGTNKRKIGNGTTNQQSLFNFLGKTQEKSIEKIEKDYSMTTKHLCKQNEPVMIAIDKKQKIEKIHKE